MSFERTPPNPHFYDFCLKVRLSPRDTEKIKEWQRKIYDGGTPLMKDLKAYQVEREKERRRKLNSISGPVLEPEMSLNQFMKTDEGKSQKDKHREEFKTLFDGNSESENESDGDEKSEGEVEIEPEEDLTKKVSKKERLKLKKGSKDKVEEFDFNAF